MTQFAFLWTYFVFALEGRGRVGRGVSPGSQSRAPCPSPGRGGVDAASVGACLVLTDFQQHGPGWNRSNPNLRGRIRRFQCTFRRSSGLPRSPCEVENLDSRRYSPNYRNALPSRTSYPWEDKLDRQRHKYLAS